MNKEAIIQIELDEELKKLEQLIAPPQLCEYRVAPIIDYGVLKGMVEIENNYQDYVDNLEIEFQKKKDLEDTQTFLQRLREELADENVNEHSESTADYECEISLSNSSECDFSSEYNNNSCESEISTNEQEQIGNLFEMQIEKLLHQVWQQNKLYSDDDDVVDDNELAIAIEDDIDDDDAEEEPSNKTPIFEWPEQVIVEEFLGELQFPKKFNFDWSN
jgi:hypothetical protein